MALYHIVLIEGIHHIRPPKVILPPTSSYIPQILLGFRLLQICLLLFLSLFLNYIFLVHLFTFLDYAFVYLCFTLNRFLLSTNWDYCGSKTLEIRCTRSIDISRRISNTFTLKNPQFCAAMNLLVEAFIGSQLWDPGDFLNPICLVSMRPQYYC